MNKNHLIILLKKILKKNLDLNFLSKLESEELEILVACIRDRLDQEGE